MNAIRTGMRLARRYPRLARRLGALAVRHPRRTLAVARTLRRGSATLATLRQAGADSELRRHAGRMGVAAVSAARRARAVGIGRLAGDAAVAADMSRARAELSEVLASPGAGRAKAASRKKRRAALTGLAAAGAAAAYAAARASGSSRRASIPVEHDRERPARVPVP